MKYDCGHDGCDVCGARTCAGMRLLKVGDCLVCELCMVKAVKLAIHVAESFSTYIDVAKPCGHDNKGLMRLPKDIPLLPPRKEHQ